MHKIDGRGDDEKKWKHQKLGILTYGINANNTGNASFPCNGVDVGYSCKDIEYTLIGSFIFILILMIVEEVRVISVRKL